MPIVEKYLSSKYIEEVPSKRLYIEDFYKNKKVIRLADILGVELPSSEVDENFLKTLMAEKIEGDKKETAERYEKMLEDERDIFNIFGVEKTDDMAQLKVGQVEYLKSYKTKRERAD